MGVIQSIPPLPFFYLRFVAVPGALDAGSKEVRAARAWHATLKAFEALSTHSKHSRRTHHHQHAQGIQATTQDTQCIQGIQHIQGIQCTHNFVVLSRQQNVHGVWATATFRQKSSRRVGHSNISRFQDPASRGQILWSGRRPDPVGVSINRTIISDGFSVLDSPGPIWAVFGALRAKPGTGHFREVHATEISIDTPGRASDVDTKRDKKNHDEDIIFDHAPESKKYEPTSGHLKIELASRTRWAPRASRRRRRSRA